MTNDEVNVERLRRYDERSWELTVANLMEHARTALANEPPDNWEPGIGSAQIKADAEGRNG